MRLLLLLLAFACLQVFSVSIYKLDGEPDMVEISCENGHTDKVVYKTESVQLRYRPLQYEAQGSIYGKLAQNVKIDGAGDCYELFMRFR